MTILNKIPTMSDEERLALFHNAIRHIHENKRIDEAQAVLNALQDLWAAQLKEFYDGKFKAPSPKTGVLGALGYHVGETKGVNEEKRRTILDFIMSGVLPPVGTPAHYAEWGTPNSKQRYAKLHRVLQSFATSSKHWQDPHETNLIKAGREWNDDLRYIEEKWKP